jgi:hypothetical protein
MTQGTTQPDRFQVDFVDGHVHLDHTRERQPERLTWLRQVGCLPVSWAFSHRADSVQDLRAYLSARVKTFEAVRAGGLACYHLVGVHPRTIPPDLAPEAVRALLLPFLDDPFCRGLGEIGLETGSSREAEILEAQLALAPEIEQRDQVLGLHTPREDKARVLDQTLALLEPYRRWHDRILLDHLTPDTLPVALAAGFWAGMTLSPAKCSAADVEIAAARLPGLTDRLLLNTDSGGRFFEDLYRFHQQGALPNDLRRRLCRDNALRFFRLEGRV